MATNTPDPTWWNASWLNRTKITFDNSSSSENLADFPLLVSLSSANVDYAKIKAGGADIRFVDNDGTLLNYEIGSWDDGTETASIWVKVQQIDQSSSTDYIHLYYNNSTATDASSTATWNSDYQGVWHLNEGTGDLAIDATANTNDATANNNPVASTGKVGLGGALTFFSTSELNIAADASLDLSTYSDWTISAWVKPTSYAGLKWPLVYSYGIYDASLGLTVKEGMDGLIENWINDSALLKSNTVTMFNDWNHIAISRDATSDTTTFYLNGIADGSGANISISAGGQASFIGGDSFASDQLSG